MAMASFTKITGELTNGKGVVGLPDTPNLSTGDMQRKFDELSTDVIIPFVNEHMDELGNNEAASKIGAKPTSSMPSSTTNDLQSVLEELDAMTNRALEGVTFEVQSGSGHLIVTYPDGTVSDKGPISLTSKGDYSSSSGYDALSLVRYNNALYIAKRIVPVNVSPADTNYWDMLIDTSDIVEEVTADITTLENKVKKTLEIVSFDASTGTLTTRTMQ